MAKDSDKRKSWFDDEEEDDLVSKPTSTVQKTGQAASGQRNATVPQGPISDSEFNELRSLMEQTHQLQLMYFQGVERRPPMEKVLLLEKRFADQQRVMMNWPSATRFKMQQLAQQFNTYKELWARKAKEKERT